MQYMISRLHLKVGRLCGKLFLENINFFKETFHADIRYTENIYRTKYMTCISLGNSSFIYCGAAYAGPKS